MAPDNQRYRVLQRRASQRIISFGVSDAAIRRVRQKVAAGFSALRLGIVNCVFLKVCYTPVSYTHLTLPTKLEV